MASGLAHSAARGAFFTLAAQAAKILLQLLSVIVLARLLSPHDYGLLAIVLVIVGVGEIFRDFGLTSASIQAPTLSTGQRDNLFWVNAAIGAALSLVMFGLSWPLAALTGEGELLGLIQVLSTVFLLNGLATQHRANLMRALQFRSLAIIDVAAAAIALATAIVAALAGAGFWALAIQQLTSGVVVLVGCVWAGKWLPRRFDRSASIRELIAFGWNIVATNLLVYAGSQTDTVLVGMKFGTEPLGLYNRAYQVLMTPLAQVRSPLKGVAVPVLARVQEDPPRFNAYVCAAQLALGYVLGLPLALVVGLSGPVVELMLGAQWTEATPLLRMFAIAGILTTLSFVGYWVYLTRGLGKQLFRYTIVTTIIKIVTLVIGSMFGLVGVAVAFAVAPAISWPLSLFWLSRITPMPTKQLYAGAFRVLLAAGLAAGGAAVVVMALPAWPAAALVAAGAVVGLAAASFLLLFPVFRRDARSILSFGRLMLRRTEA